MHINNTSIIILTFNNLQLTKDCINSIKSFAPKDSYEIIIVDNNSTDGTREWLLKQNDIKTILNDINLGFPIGCNQGITSANPDNDILLLNNDVIFTPNLLENMRTALYSSDNIGAVGPVSNSVSNEQQINIALNDFSQIVDFAKSYNISNNTMWEEKCVLIGYCLLIKNSVIKLVGHLDPIYTPGNYEDCDYSLRIIEAGYKLLCLHDTFIYHLGSATFKQNPSVYSYFTSNRTKFEEKWLFNHDYVSKVDEELIKLINVDLNSKINILQVDCGLGLNLLKLKYKFKDSTVYGIEFNKNLAKFTSDTINLSNNFFSDFEYESLDYVIIGDSIHNVISINDYINEISKYLKPNGHIILKVYNFLFANNLVELFSGNVSTSALSLSYRNNLSFSDMVAFMNNCNFSLVFGSCVFSELTDDGNALIPKLRHLTSKDETAQYCTQYYAMDFIKI